MKLKIVRTVTHRLPHGMRYLERRPLNGEPLNPIEEMYLVVEGLRVKEVRVHEGDKVEWYSRVEPVPEHPGYAQIVDFRVKVNGEAAIVDGTYF